VSDELKPMPVYFPEDVKQRLRREAFDREVSMSAIVVEAVREKLGMTSVEEGDG
jgi:hypothetical protein